MSAVDPWVKICAQIWQDRLDATPSPWPADRVIKHECQDDKPAPIPTMNEQRVLDLLKDGPLSVGGLAEALCVRVDTVSTQLNRMLRRGFVEHQGRSWMVKRAATA